MALREEKLMAHYVLVSLEPAARQVDGHRDPAVARVP